MLFCCCCSIIKVTCGAFDACGPDLTTVPDVTVVIKKGETVYATGDANTELTFSGSPGNYDVTYILPSPYGWTRTVTYSLGCGINRPREFFLVNIYVKVYGEFEDYDPSDATKLLRKTECLDDVTVSAKYLGSTCTGSVSTLPNCIYKMAVTTDLGALSDIVGSDLVVTAKYLGTECSQNFNTSNGCFFFDLVYRTGGSVQILGCNQMPLASVTCTGPTGETATSDENGIAVIHPYTAAYCKGDYRLVWVLTKTRFLIKSEVPDTSFECPGAGPCTQTKFVQMAPNNGGSYSGYGGYWCSGCCADPLPYELHCSITSTSGDSDYITLYHQGAGAWVGSVTKNETSINLVPGECFTSGVGAATTAVYPVFSSSGGISCSLAAYVPVCSGFGVTFNANDDGTNLSGFGGGGGGFNNVGGLPDTVTCPDDGFVWSGTYTVTQTLYGSRKYYYGSVDVVVTE